MKSLIYLIFILLSFGQWQRISFLDQQVNIYLHEIVMAFVVIGQIRQIGLIRRIREILLFLGVLLLSLINNFWQFSWLENLVGFLYWLRLVLYFGFFFILFCHLKEEKTASKTVRWGLNIFLLLTVIFSYLQYFLYSDLRNLVYLGWDPHQYRVFGLFFDTSVAGIIFVILFFWLIAQQEMGQIRLIGVIGLIGLILLTYSRITYLSFIVGMIYYFKDKISFVKIIGLIFGFLILIFLLPRPVGESVKLERWFTIEARMNDWRKGIKIWKENPILGLGYNRIRSVKKELQSHAGASFSSTFFTLLVASGIVGLAVLINLMRHFYLKTNNLGRTVVIVVVTASLFDNIFLNNLVLLLFISILALTIPLFDS